MEVITHGITASSKIKPLLLAADGSIIVAQIVSSLPAGDNNIGNVDVVTLPTLPAGDNNIGNVDVVTLPSIPTGTNEIGMIQARNYGWISSAWKKDPLRMGYSGQVVESAASTNLASGYNSLTTSAVPSGRIWIATNISFKYFGTMTNVILECRLMNPNIHLYKAPQPPVSNLLYDRQTWVVMKATDFIQLDIYNATAGDDASLYVNGFYFDINQ